MSESAGDEPESKTVRARCIHYNPVSQEERDNQMRTSSKVLASSLVLFASLAVHAADTSSLKGKWAGTVNNAKGERVQVQLTVADAGKATLRLAQSEGYVTRDECLDRDIPVVVTAQTATELTVDIKGESVLKGCINESATLKVIDAKTLQSTLKDGRTMTLSRK